MDAEAGLTPRTRVRVTYDEPAGGALPERPTAPEREVAGRVRLVLGAFVCVFSLLGLRLAHVSFGMTEELAVARAASVETVRPEIADRMGLTEGTIKQHNYRIYRKLSVNNRVEALRVYLGRGTQ